MQQNLNSNKPSYTGVILAGGRGTRLKPLTDIMTKALLPVADTPLIVFAIKNLVSAGVTNIVIVIQAQFATQFFQTLKNGEQWGASLSYVFHPDEIKGMPYALSMAKHAVHTSHVVVTCADMVIEGGFTQMISDSQSNPNVAMMLTSEMSDTAGFSLVEVEDKSVTKIFSKNKDRHQAGLIDLGTVVYPTDVFSKIESLYPSEAERGIWELSALYLQDKNLSASKSSGKWSDAGLNIQEYLELNEYYAKKK